MLYRSKGRYPRDDCDLLPLSFRASAHSLYTYKTGEMMKSATKNTMKDMTVGSPTRHIFGFAIPMLLGTLFQQLYSMVDTIVVGQWIGTEALAGVGSTGSISFLIVGFCSGIGSGFAIPISQRFGAKNFDSLRSYVANALWASLILILPITVIVSILCRPILVLMQTPTETFDYSYNYIFVIFLGIPITYSYNLLAGIMRALGDSKTPVIFVMIAAGLNVVLDILSVGVLGMGTEGPALATIVSQAVSALCCLLYMKRRMPILRLKREEWKLVWRRVGILFSMGIPMGLQYSITAIGSVVLQSSVNSLGWMAQAAKAAGDKLHSFVACPLDTVAFAMATYAGQNVGCGKLKRVDKGLRSAMLISCIYSVAVFFVILLLGKPLLLIFIEKGEEVILGDAYSLCVIYAATYVLLSIVNNFRLTIQGMGFSAFSIFSGLSEMVGRMLIGFAFVPIYGYIAACFASPLAWVFASIFLIPAYFLCRRKLYRTIRTVEE